MSAAVMSLRGTCDTSDCPNRESMDFLSSWLRRITPAELHNVLLWCWLHSKDGFLLLYHQCVKPIKVGHSVVLLEVNLCAVLCLLRCLLRGLQVTLLISFVIVPLDYFCKLGFHCVDI